MFEERKTEKSKSKKERCVLNALCSVRVYACLFPPFLSSPVDQFPLSFTQIMGYVS